MKALLKKIIPDIFIRAVWHFPRAVLANAFFLIPSRSLTCIAVAGTKGKTSTAFFLAHILNASGQKAALFSTAAINDGNNKSLNVWKMTTPDVWLIQCFLRRAKKNHCIYAVIEVSSHALKQHRVWGVPFSLVLITNLAPDHLDYHESAEEYVGVHQQLFSRHTSACCAPEGVISNFKFQISKQTQIINIQTETSFRTNVRNPDDDQPWWIPLQQTNINAALCAARKLGISEEHLERALETLPCPPGRFESIDEGQPFRVIVDYAHSPESLEYFLSQIRLLVSGAVWVVFGACGDRDKTQRPLMGAVLERYADRIILTTDDPYSEDPEQIAQDIERGFQRWDDKVKILDRKEAIAYALSRASQNDCVCVLGKGAEQWQIFKDKKIPWDDREVARELLTRAQG